MSSGTCCPSAGPAAGRSNLVVLIVGLRSSGRPWLVHCAFTARSEHCIALKPDVSINISSALCSRALFHWMAGRTRRRLIDSEQIRFAAAVRCL